MTVNVSVTMTAVEAACVKEGYTKIITPTGPLEGYVQITPLIERFLSALSAAAREVSPWMAEPMHPGAVVMARPDVSASTSWRLLVRQIKGYWYDETGDEWDWDQLFNHRPLTDTERAIFGIPETMPEGYIAVRRALDEDGKDYDVSFVRGLASLAEDIVSSDAMDILDNYADALAREKEK